MFLFSFSISCFVVQSSDFFLVIFISSASAASVIIMVFLLTEQFVFLSHVYLMLFPCSLPLPPCDIWSVTLISIHLFLSSFYHILFVHLSLSSLPNLPKALCCAFLTLNCSSLPPLTSPSLPQLYTGLFSLTLLKACP